MIPAATTIAAVVASHQLTAVHSRPFIYVLKQTISCMFCYSTSVRRNYVEYCTTADFKKNKNYEWHTVK